MFEPSREVSVDVDVPAPAGMSAQGSNRGARDASSEPSLFSTSELGGLVAALGSLDADVDDGVRVEQLRLLEEVKSAAAAAQARVTSAFVDSQEATRPKGASERMVRRGVVAQVGLAKRESPHRARRYVGWARVLTAELPQTFAVLEAGKTTEWRAMIVARETIWLSREQRAAVDATIAPRLEGLGDRQVEAEVKKLAYRLDPEGFTDRSRQAEVDRRVSIRPAPDTMTYLTALLPVAQGVAAYAALKKHADTFKADGDERTRGQIMADTLVHRITGQATADAVPVSVNLVMSDRTLFGHGTADQRAEPAWLHNYGPIPAELARRLAHTAARSGGEGVASGAATAGLWLRRLYTHPDSGRLVAMETSARLFPPGLKRFIEIRDQVCRTPWCAAPVRHADHAIPFAAGGVTSAANGQGLCEWCNQAKETPGWSSTPPNGPAGTAEAVTITTPTGRQYTSRPPDPPGGAHDAFPRGRSPDHPDPPGQDTRAGTSAMEAWFVHLIEAA